jgi:hypothetical protein
MIFTQTNLPESYHSYQTLKVCSNTLIGGGHIVAVGDVLPLIIGKGDKPQIWLQALNNSKTKEFISVVENSVSKNPSVKVIEVNGTVNVIIQATKVLSVKQISKNSAVVDFIDLRLLGVNIQGNASSMTVGGSTFSGNSMKGSSVLIGIGD